MPDILGPHVTEGEWTYPQRRLNYYVEPVFLVVFLVVVVAVVLLSRRWSQSSSVGLIF
jgi:hypothetical protein